MSQVVGLKFDLLQRRGVGEVFADGGKVGKVDAQGGKDGQALKKGSEVSQYCVSLTDGARRIAYEKRVPSSDTAECATKIGTEEHHEENVL